MITLNANILRSLVVEPKFKKKTFHVIIVKSRFAVDLLISKNSKHHIILH